MAAVADDLNTAGAVTELHKLAASGDAAGVLASAQLLGLLTDELGAWAEEPALDLSALADRLHVVRVAAMESKDFSEVDRVKAALTEAGVQVKMSKEGVELVPGANVDMTKLEALK